MQLVIDEPTYTFPGYGNIPSVFRLRVYRDGERFVVLATDIAMNGEDTGTSITNGAERWAAQVWALLGFPKKITFVEHYQAGRYGDPSNTETLARIVFNLVDSEQRPELQTPHWTHMTRDELEALVGQQVA